MADSCNPRHVSTEADGGRRLIRTRMAIAAACESLWLGFLAWLAWLS